MIRRVEQEVGGNHKSPPNWWGRKKKKPKAGLFEGFVEDASWPGFSGTAQMSVPLVTSVHLSFTQSWEAALNLGSSPGG